MHGEQKITSVYITFTLFCSTSGFSNRLVSFGMISRIFLADTCQGSMPWPIKPKCVIHSSQQFWFARYNKRGQITELSNQLLQLCYSRLQNKHRGTLINFWTFFQGLRSLLERVMHIIFQNIRFLLVWGMPILEAMLNIIAKFSRGYVYSRGYIYSRV